MLKINYARTSRGFSLIELMVAMLIGLLVLAGVIQVVLNSKRSFLDNQETAFIQDNTRYALDIIAKDFRATGYRGCAADEPVIVDVIKTDSKKSVADAFGNDLPAVSGTEAGTPESLKVDKLDTVIPSDESIPLPDALTLRTVSNENELTLRSQDISTSKLTTWQEMDYPAGTPIMVIDASCQNIALLMTDTDLDKKTELTYTKNSCAKGLTSIASFDCSTGNINKIKLLSTGSSLFPYVANTYFIGPSVTEGMPALKRRYIKVNKGELNYSTEEIAQGVENMQVTYGVDSDRDGAVDGAFTTATDVKDWKNVIAINIELTLRSSMRVLPVGKEKKEDGFLRKKVASTISLRNRGV
jgi:type IV pilus assembly protein PilW